MDKVHKPFYLAIDQGGQSSRAILFDSIGGVVDRAQFEVPTQRLGSEIVEHDAEVLLRSVQNATRSSLNLARWLGARSVALPSR